MQSNNPNKKNTGSQSSKPAPEKKGSGFSFEELREHKNPVVRIFMKVVYSVWLGVMGIGIFFAWLISVLLL